MSIRFLISGIAALAGGLALLCATGATGTRPEAQPARVRIGTYDTRAVALAYHRSESVLRELNKEYEEGQKLKKSGDKKRFAELEAQAKERQFRMHAQVFSNVPIDDLMAAMKDALPGIARQAGVSAIIPRVDYHDDAVEAVDVTDALVRHCKPSEKTLKMIAEMRKHPPLSLKQVSEMKD